jgi:DNA repair exonuclease SbcCD ATPase subunit
MSFKCAHISDIHWRGLKRHDEYKKVFKLLFEKLRGLELDAIFIGGDIVHSKTQGISPEIIESLTWWFESLAEIAPTHVILGNHDGLILNEDRQDAITPILSAINNPDIFLYKKSGTYPIGIEGFNWCVFSCFDEKGWKDVKPVDNEINIACFHGSVLGSKTDTDWELEGEVNLSFFDDYDFSFLGDIHKVQYLDEEKRVAYPGSTIQQNYGEDILKGFLYWEINSKHDYKSKFISVPNPHPFLTLDWRGTVEETISFASKVKKGVRFRVRSKETISQAEIKLLHYYLKEKNNANEIVYQVLNKSSSENKLLANDFKPKLDIRNKNDRYSLFKDLWSDKLEEKEMSDLDEIFIKSLDNVPNTFSDVSGQKWSINSMEFDNTFSYGKDNFINFNNMSGVIGLFGNNRAGKSSIPGTLMYGLFNTTDRGAIKNHDIVNIRKGSCKTKINISIGADEYNVVRETIKKTNRKGITSANTKLELINLNDDFENDETDEQRRETEKILRKVIGTSEDFLYTSFASQGEMNTFIKEKSSARKSVISKFLSLDIYEELYKQSREEHIVLKNSLKRIEEKDWQGLISSCLNEIETNKSLIIESGRKLSKLRQEEVSLRLEEKETLSSSKTHPSGYTLDSANKELNNLKERKLNIEFKISNLDLEKEKIGTSLVKINSFKSQYPVEQLEEEKSKLNSLLKKLRDFKTLKFSLEQEKKNVDKDLNILSQVPCEDKYPTCMFIENAYNSKDKNKEIINSLREIEGSIYEVQGVVKSIEKESIEKKLKKYNDVINKEYKLNVDLENTGIKISALKEKYNVNLEKIEKLSVLIEELLLFDSNDLGLKLKEIKRELNRVSDLIYNEEFNSKKIEKSQFQLESKIKTLNNEKKDYNNLIKKWKVYDLFSHAVSKKGIPTMLIKSCLPKINNEISKILNGVTNFKVYLQEEEDNNNLNVYIDYGDSKRVIECASGMEKMMSSIAIRVALTNISSLSKSDVFIIDEGFGALDESNVEACGRLLSSLKKYFKTIIIISHVDAIKDIVDKNIEISMKGNDSYVYYG